MNVLSLFDGLSVGYLALKRADIQISKYLASEVEPHIVKLSARNFPDIIQLGDVEKWREWDLPRIDLLIGGSPCTGFSMAGRRLNFEDPQSKLFFEYVDILEAVNPRFFLLENVPMRQEWIDVISSYMEVEPIEINSSLVSGQHRRRLYWTNIPFKKPKDKGILLKDVLLKNAPPELDLSKKALAYMNRKVKGGRSHWDFCHFSDSTSPKSHAVVANFFKGVPYNVLKHEGRIRHFDPVECERLQTLPDNFTEGIPKTHRFKAIGNAWTADVITQIFKGLPRSKTKNSPRQKYLFPRFKGTKQDRITKGKEDYIVSFSGGKDSTAMLLMMLERKEPIHSVVFFDTGWEFPQMLKHVREVEKRTGIKIWRLKPGLPFEYWLTSRPILHKDKKRRDQLKKIGLGWPQWNSRWCTGLKVNCLKRFARPILNGVQCIGYAKDEEDRSFLTTTSATRFPLIEWGITEKEALEYCYSKGYDWGGLYDIFSRVSCYCCPLQGNDALFALRSNFPKLWRKLQTWDKCIQNNRRKDGSSYFGFKNNLSLKDLENNF